MQKILASSGGVETLFSDDVFQAYTRTGTGADVTVTTNIGMTKGYMLWSKGRSGATDHAIYDSARGVTLDLVSNSTAAQTTQSTGLKSVSATGHTIGALAKMNTSAATYVDFVFRKAPKFFDVVTYTGTAGDQTINHSLGGTVGMIIVKNTGASGNWIVWHKDLSAGNEVFLNLTNAASAQNDFGTVGSTSFVVKNGMPTNTTGNSYVAYLFAHDTATDGIVQCGSVALDGSAAGSVTLGWEPQYILWKPSTIAGNWYIEDCMRGMSQTYGGELLANTNAAEVTAASADLKPNATGFSIAAGHSGQTSQTFIYLAIRRPNKPPTTGTQVFSPLSSTTSTGTKQTTGFSVDLQIATATYGVTTGFNDRLRGVSTTSTEMEVRLTSVSTAAEQTSGGVGTKFWDNTGFQTHSYLGGGNMTSWNFKRAVGCFDVVCYTGDNTYSGKSHGLGVAPELLIQKSRSSAANWHAGIPRKRAYLNLTDAADDPGALSWTATTFQPWVDSTAVNYVCYLFATLAGVSKVFSYTGDGSTGKVINCGFSAGARFILIKRTDSTGDWFVYDTTRTYPAGNDYHLSLNTTAAEVVTTDDVDYEASGFIVNQNATTNLNVTSATYIGLAFA